MSADRHEDRIHDATTEMARGGEQMEERLDELSDQIDEAKSTAARRQDAPEQTEPPAETENVAGDWQGESSGAEQGEDAEDAEGDQRGADESGDAEPAS